MPYYAYLLASGRNGTLYTGVTSDLIARVHQHLTHELGGFTDRYDVTQLVWFETHDDIHEAVLREKRIKRWRREWKLALIEGANPSWRDLWEDLTT